MVQNSLEPHPKLEFVQHTGQRPCTEKNVTLDQRQHSIYLEMNGPTKKGENPSYLIFIIKYCLCYSNKCLLIFSQSRGYFKQQCMIFYKGKPIKNTILTCFNELIRMFNSSWLCWINNYNIYFTYVKYVYKIIAPYI